MTSEIRLPYETENPQIKLYGIKNSTEDMRGNMPESMEQQDKKVCETGYEHGFHREMKRGGITKWEIMSPGRQPL